MNGPRQRREFLIGALGALAGAGVARQALALSPEPMNVPTERLLATTCHDRTMHPKLLAEIAEKLGQITPEERQRIVDGATCPFCGCRLSHAMWARVSAAVVLRYCRLRSMP